MTALEPGQLVDGYRLEERLHQGGMATLWRVVPVAGSAPDGLPLLMKVPRIKGGEDPATIVGFEVEQMIMPTLSGPHVPRFVAKGGFDQQPYVVMEQIPGDTLRPRLEAAPIPIDEVVQHGIRIATALHDLHRQHVVHLDVKPSNIMFRPTGEAVLIDFGLSHHDHLPDLLEEEFNQPTDPKMIGTGPYMSPEQVQFVRDEPRSDLFSLGVLLYHLATGARPFGLPQSMRALRRRLFEEPRPPRALRPEIPPWLQEIILRCLEVRAPDRHPSAGQLAFELQHPAQVPLTDRALRLQRRAGPSMIKRWFRAIGDEPAAINAPSSPAQALIGRSPIVMAALDVDGATPELLAQIRETVRRALAAEPGARLACVGVMKTARIGMDELTDRQGRSHHVRQLSALEHWARPLAKALQLGPGRLTCHVLEAPDPAAAIVEFAQRNQADHIVMGARGASAMRRWLGSVSSQVVAEAPCTVTVARVPGGQAEAPRPPALPEP